MVSEIGRRLYDSMTWWRASIIKR